jgi:hypothetical protein
MDPGPSSRYSPRSPYRMSYYGSWSHCSPTVDPSNHVSCTEISGTKTRRPTCERESHSFSIQAPCMPTMNMRLGTGGRSDIDSATYHICEATSGIFPLLNLVSKSFHVRKELTLREVVQRRIGTRVTLYTLYVTTFQQQFCSLGPSNDRSRLTTVIVMVTAKYP